MSALNGVTKSSEFNLSNFKQVINPRNRLNEVPFVTLHKSGVIFLGKNLAEKFSKYKYAEIFIHPKQKVVAISFINSKKPHCSHVTKKGGGGSNISIAFALSQLKHRVLVRKRYTPIIQKSVLYINLEDKYAS